MPVRTIFFVILLAVAGPFTGFCQRGSHVLQTSAQARIHWKTSARLHERLTSTRGTIEIGSQGIIFRADKGKIHQWSFQDIQSFFITRHRLRIRSYDNRGWRLPGEKIYRFHLSRAVPPEIAAALAARVGKPSLNGDPNPHTPAFATIPARHVTLTGGSNGTLRFNRNGVDYVTSSARDSRSWRWADIETIAQPSAYQFTVGGYRETYNFKLKQAMSRRVFDRLWDNVYGRGLQLSAGISVK